MGLERKVKRSVKQKKRMWGRRAWDREGGWGKSGGAERRKDGEFWCQTEAV